MSSQASSTQHRADGSSATPAPTDRSNGSHSANSAPWESMHTAKRPRCATSEGSTSTRPPSASTTARLASMSSLRKKQVQDGGWVSSASSCIPATSGPPMSARVNMR